MDMTDKSKEKPLWVFTDNARENLPIQGVFVSCALEISKGAVQYPVITIDSGGRKIKTSRWRTDCNAMFIFGTNSEDWTGKLVQLKLSEKGNNLILEPLEQNLAR